MKAIVGLGNPGDEYRNTRHNIGWMTLDALTGKWRLSAWKKEFQSLSLRKTIRGEEYIILKPQTYMNNSGNAVLLMSRMLGIRPQDILLVFDAAELDFGTIRIRRKGSSGGHNGVQSVIDCLGTEQIPRVKIGIFAPDPGIRELRDFVLRRFNDEQQQALPALIRQAVQAIERWAFEGVDAAMNHFNGKESR